MSSAVIERLDRIEGQLATLLARSAGETRKSDPDRISKRQTAKKLSCSTRQIDRYVALGLLVKLARVPGRRTTYFHPANVDALIRSEDAARDWIASRKYVPFGKRLAVSR
jgi:hypothetical protein